ncbi:TPA: right-handed parallel beta-helix repeat-containing protein [Raoultella planticola]
MYHLDNTSGVPEMPEPKDEQSMTPRWFGESQEQGGISWPGADWFNTVQAELLNILSDAGMPPNKKVFNQISRAVALLGSDAFRQDLGLSDGFKLVGQVGSAVLLAQLPGSEGDRVLLRSYNEITAVELPMGGGEFYYVSSLVGENNGVTVFNGWCRKNIAELSTWDAGLTPDDDTDASPGIQRLFDAAQSGCTIYIDGRHCITRPHYLRGKSNLKILPRNGGFLDGVTLKDQFEFILVDGWEYYAPYVGATQGYPGGIISAIDCPGIEIGERLKIRGPKKRFNRTAVDVTLRREYGDSGIQLRNCPGAKINKNDAYHFWAWGIYGSAGGHNSEANENYVGDCAVQSGIAIWNGCNNCQGNDNVITDARLYGLEIEVLDSVKAVYGKVVGAKGRGNKVSGSKWAVAVVGGVFTAEITKTEIEDCFYGFNAVKNKDVPRKIDFIHNNVSRTLVHTHVSGSQNVHVDHNDLINTVKPDYAVLNQYSVIVDLETDPTKFRIFYSGNVNLTTTVQIRGQVYTILNRVVVDDASYHYGESRYVIVTVDRILASDVEVGDTLLHSTEFVDITAHATSLIYQEDDAYLKGVTFGKNNMIGAFKVYERFETVFADNETIAISSFGHSVIKTANSVITPAYRFARASAWSNAIEMRGIDHSEGLGFYLPVKSGATKNTKPHREIQRSKIVSIAAGGTFPVEYFYDNSDRMVIGIDITLTNVHSGSNIQLRIDGTTVYPVVFAANAATTAVASFKDQNMTVGLAANANTGTGRHSMQLFTSDNTAVCDGYTITLYLL